MPLLPEGFALPPAPYLLALVVAAGAVAYGYRVRRPVLTDRVVLAFAPWMVAGAWLHVLHVVGGAPAALDPLLGTPSVYVSVGILAGGTWLAADAVPLPEEKIVAATGTLLAAVPLVVAVAGAERLRLGPSLVALVGSLVLGPAAWYALTFWRRRVAYTGGAGVLALTGHTLDGVSTAVGVDLLGFGERTPLSRLIIEFAASLPTAPAIGSGWLFVIVKLAVAGFVVTLLADYVREDPEEGRALLLVVAAVGLGPGAHNLLLFAVA